MSDSSLEEVGSWKETKALEKCFEVEVCLNVVNALDRVMHVKKLIKVNSRYRIAISISFFVQRVLSFKVPVLIFSSTSRDVGSVGSESELLRYVDGNRMDECRSSSSKRRAVWSTL